MGYKAGLWHFMGQLVLQLYGKSGDNMAMSDFWETPFLNAADNLYS